MFGYVAIDKPNILVKDFYTYKSYYCGLCKVLGKRYNQLLRLTTNYDIVLLSLLAHNYDKVIPEYSLERCVLHPIGKKFAVAKSDEIFGRIADINIILAYHKVLDDVLDDGSKKTLERYLRGRYKKLKTNYAELCESLEGSFAKLRDLEKDGCKSPELPAGCFGEVMTAVAHAATKNCDALLEKLCYSLGKWIYYIDAIDDIGKDAEKSKYNVFLSKNSVVDDKFFSDSDVFFRKLLYSEISAITEAYDKMDITVSEGATSNIVYRGLRARTELVLSRKGCKDKTGGMI